MKVLVTGASGFIGKHIVSHLLDIGYEVIALSRSINNTTFKINKNLTLIEYEISSDNEMNFEFMQEVDSLLHLAWSNIEDVNSEVHLSKIFPMHLRFLKYAINKGIKNIFVLGSCYEYGMCEGSIREDHLIDPITSYGKSKNMLRLELEKLSLKQPFNLVWGRLFYIYGEGQAPSAIYSQLISSLKQGNKEFKMSQGDQILDYLHVREAINIIVQLLIKQVNIGCVNICSGKPVALQSLVSHWIVGQKSDINLILGAYPYRSFEPRTFWGDRAYLDSLLKL